MESDIDVNTPKKGGKGIVHELRIEYQKIIIFYNTIKNNEIIDAFLISKHIFTDCFDVWATCQIVVPSCEKTCKICSGNSFELLNEIIYFAVL